MNVGWNTRLTPLANDWLSPDWRVIVYVPAFSLIAVILDATTPAIKVPPVSVSNR